MGTPPTSKSRLFSAVSSSSTGALLAATGTMGGATDLAGIFLGVPRGDARTRARGPRGRVAQGEVRRRALGAALAVNIALAEADAVSPALDAFTQTQLKRLCSGILSTLGLARARAGVRSVQPRAKILRILWYRATESKFDELRKDLETLEAQLWNLTGAVGGLGAGARRRRATPRLRPSVDPGT